MYLGANRRTGQRNRCLLSHSLNLMYTPSGSEPHDISMAQSLCRIDTSRVEPLISSYTPICRASCCSHGVSGGRLGYKRGVINGLQRRQNKVAYESQHQPMRNDNPTVSRCSIIIWPHGRNATYTMSINYSPAYIHVNSSSHEPLGSNLTTR